MTITLIHSDNLLSIYGLQRASTRVDLVYMDPPFNTGKTQSGSAGSFEDQLMPTGEFAAEIARVASASWELLSDSGCLVVHVDPKTSHYVKVALDNALGSYHFASEIIWRYKRWPTKTRNFQRVHDVLLRYVKDPKSATWNQLYEPLSESTRKTWGTRRQKAKIVERKRIRSTTTDVESPGCPMGDVWDIPIIAPIAKERTGWPTQKPEALLERLILACTNEGDTVLDPYLGSGTSLAVAQRLNRNGIGIDSNQQAIEVARKRIGGAL